LYSSDKYKTPAAERTEFMVGIASILAPVVGPIFMLPMFWVYTPHGYGPWLASLGVGLIPALLVIATLCLPLRRGDLGPMQVVFAGLFLGFGVMTATSGISLLINGAFDRSPAASYQATVDEMWARTTTMTDRYSNTRSKNHRAWVNLTLKDGPVESLQKVVIDPQPPFPGEGEPVRVRVHPGALGWPWGVHLEAPEQAGGQASP
jgi:hypothetical protein